MEVLVLIALLGRAAGAIASSKGRSFFGYFLLGTFIPVVGLILAAALPKVERNLDRRMVEKGERRECPFCAELIRPGAKVCRYCGRDLPAPAQLLAAPRTPGTTWEIPPSAAIRCADCGALNPPGSRDCRRCHVPL